jgi:hypothetical protein
MRFTGGRVLAALALFGLFESTSAAAVGLIDQSPKQEQSAPQKHGHIDYETFRLLSTGMSETEVLQLAGWPESMEGLIWRYTYGDRWVVDVSFSDSGYVINVNNYRLP